jgi:hypothetical protein
MSRPFSKTAIALVMLVAVSFALFGSLTRAAATTPLTTPTVAEVPVLATAPAPPNVVPAVLNGKPVYVLYMTRSSDTVLVRCYPGFQPTLSVGTDGQGTLLCNQQIQPM